MLGYLKSTQELFGSRRISTLSWEEIEELRNRRLSEVSPSYCRKELIMMGAVLQRQVKARRLAVNPVKQVDLPRFNDTRERILSDYEFRRLLNVRWEVDKKRYKLTKGMEPYMRLALVIADYTAMRIGEILDMQWKNVDLVNGLIFVPESKNGSRRLVPIHDELRKILFAQSKRSHFVVCHHRRQVRSIRKGFAKARYKAGLSDLRIHDFRHRAITRWIQQGHPINAIMKATGHKTYSAFLRYANLKEGDVQSLVGRKAEPLPLITYDDFCKVA
jgi:integrase